MLPITRLTGRLGNQMFQIAYIYAKHWRGETPDIYLQYPHYFDDHRKEIQRLFGDGVGMPRDEVSIHVRRGDYKIDPAFVKLWETDYYERAMALFPDRDFLVFSDEPEWCQRKWAGDPRVRVVTGQDELQDMNMMAECMDNIIANSSFSWWAAYINRNPKKRVIYPKAWHTDGIVRVGFPQEWESL